MSVSSIKAIITDLDRTLLRTDKSLSEYTVSVMKKCKERGIKLIAATARPERASVPYSEMLCFDAMVLSNGARVLCGGEKREFPILRESAVRILDSLQKHKDLPITLETGEVAYSNLPVPDYETIVTNDLSNVAIHEGALKILFHLDSSCINNVLLDDVYCTASNGYLMQIMSLEATKWNGIRMVLDNFGISPEETVYFGDDHDDIEAIKMCGIGVAVSNAIAEVKDAADIICGTNDSDGVADFLEKNIIKKA